MRVRNMMNIYYIEGDKQEVFLLLSHNLPQQIYFFMTQNGCFLLLYSVQNNRSQP